MSLPHALLGLIAIAPATGYELTKEFEQDLGRYAWQAGHTSIYPELNRLAGRGLVRVQHEGPRGAKTYEITGQGREELRTWLLCPPGATRVVRNEQILRMFLIPALTPADRRSMLTAIAQDAARTAAQIRASLTSRDDPDRDDRPDRRGYARLAGELGVRQLDATRDWAQWALRELGADAPEAATR